MHALYSIFVFGFMVSVLAITVFRLRRGGPGPAVNWVPRSLRGRVNRRYEARGWQKPFNDDGSRNEDRGQI